MKTILALVVLSVALASVSGYENYNKKRQITVDDLTRQYCGMKNRQAFNYCLRENGVEIIADFYSNCARQVKYYETLDEIKKFICNTRTDAEYAKYLQCFAPAANAESKVNPNLLEITQKCLDEVSGHE
ncbi:uncharacterized protein [Centruroides vittatus]|uniref:uncharacterized protein n=1 Tax=Centruroides vittatus TaxID=120091 RepID=UPI00350FA389